MGAMDQEIITPPNTPKSANPMLSAPWPAFSLQRGATLMTLSLLGAAAAASVWAFAKLLGLPDMVLYAVLAAAFLPVLWATVWIAGRSWHVEQRLANGLDVDTPVFRARPLPQVHAQGLRAFLPQNGGFEPLSCGSESGKMFSCPSGQTLPGRRNRLAPQSVISLRGFPARVPFPKNPLPSPSA